MAISWSYAFDEVVAHEEGVRFQLLALRNSAGRNGTTEVKKDGGEDALTEGWGRLSETMASTGGYTTIFFQGKERGARNLQFEILEKNLIPLEEFGGEGEP